MIVTSILSLAILLLPTLSISVDLGSALVTLSPYLSIVNYYLPLDIFVTCAITVFSTWIICSTFSFVIEIL